MSKNQPDNLGFSLWQAAGVILTDLRWYYEALTEKKEASLPLDFDEIQRGNEIHSSNALADWFLPICALGNQVDMPPDMRPNMQDLYRFIVDKGLYLATIQALDARMELLQPCIDSLERQKRIYKDDPLMRTIEESEYRRTNDILDWLIYMKNQQDQQPTSQTADQEQNVPGRKEKLSLDTFRREIYQELNKQFPKDQKNRPGIKKVCKKWGLQYGVSESTIRRDLDILQNKGE